MASSPDARLLAAYCAADYEIQAPRPFTLHVGAASAQLVALHRLFRVARSAVVTASNPRGDRRNAQANALAHQRLVDDVTERGWLFFAATNRDPHGGWPDEAALLVLGPDEAAALELGRRFGQAAVLFNAEDAVPRLLWCHPS